MQKLKVLFFAPNYANKFNLVSVCIQNQAEFLIKRYNFQVSVITICHKLPEKSILNEVSIYNINVNLIRENKKTLFSEFLNFDIIQIFSVSNLISSLGINFAYHNKIPYIISPHGDLDKIKFKNWSQRICYHFKYKIRLNSAKAIQFCTEAEFINAYLPLRIQPVVIPLGFEFETLINYNRIENSSSIFQILIFRFQNDEVFQLNLQNALVKICLENNLNIELYFINEIPNNYQNTLKSIKVNKIKNRFFNFFNDHEFNFAIIGGENDHFGVQIVKTLENKIPILIDSKMKLSEWVIKKECGYIFEQNQESIENNLKIVVNQNKKELSEMGFNGYLAVKKLFSVKIVSHLHQELYHLIMNLNK